MTTTTHTCILCGSEIPTGAHREFDEVTQKVVSICRECFKARMNRAARDAHEDSGERATCSD